MLGLGILWIKNPETQVFSTVVCYPCLTPSGNVTDRLHPRIPWNPLVTDHALSSTASPGAPTEQHSRWGEQVILCAQLLTFLGRFPKKKLRSLELWILRILKWMIFFLFWVGSYYFISLDDTKKNIFFGIREDRMRVEVNGSWSQVSIPPIIFMREVLGKIILIWI